MTTYDVLEKNKENRDWWSIEKNPLEDPFDARLRNAAFFMRHILNLEIAVFHREWLWLCDNNRNVCIMAPRGHGKTEVLIIGWMLYSMYMAVMDIKEGIWKHADVRNWFEGMIVSKSMPQSTSVLRRLKYRMLDHPFLKRLLGTGREGKETATELILIGRHKIVCRPYGDQIRGIHVNLACIDEAGTFEDQTIFNYAIQPTIQKYHGKISAIGTPTSQVDLLYNLFNNPRFKSKKYQAFKDPVQQKKPLWPSEFPKRKLIEIKETIGSLAFSREYMCEPVGEEDRIFPHHLIEKGFLQRAGWVKEARSSDVSYWIGCDFAMSAAVGADYSVFVVIERDMNGKCRICDIYRAKGKSFKEQMHHLRVLYARYHPTNVMIDARTFGESFLQQMRDEGMRVEGHKDTRASKEKVIMHLRNQFEKLKVLIPRGRETRPETDDLVNELLSYTVVITPQKQVTYEGTGAHDDCVSALALAIYVATRYTYSPLTVARTSYSKR